MPNPNGVKLPPASAIAKSDALKAEGNLYFGQNDFEAALQAYNAAIRIAPSQALYSNRSATYLQLDQPDNALADVDRAIQLSPGWSKAHRRKGNVLETIGRLGEARTSYMEAWRLERDPEIQEDLQRTIEAVEDRLADQRPETSYTVLPLDEAPAKIISREVEQRILNGERPGAWPPVGSCVRRLWLADLQFLEALKSLSYFQKHELPPSANALPGAFGISGPLQTLAELTSAAMEDYRVVYFDHEDFEKLQLCYMLEQQQRNAIGPALSAKETIAKYQERINNGVKWEIVRPGLQLSIREAFMNGLVKLGNMEDVALDGELNHNSAVNDFKRAVELTEEARRVFADVPGHIRGRTLETTFLRGLKIRLAESLIKQFNKTVPPSLEIVQEILTIGNWLVQSCQNEPLPDSNIPPADSDESQKYWSLYLPHWRYPRAMGHMFRGMAYQQLGLKWNQVSLDSQSGKRGPLAGNKKDLRTAAEEYARAAAWLPDDDPDLCNALWYAIHCQVRRGSYYLGDLVLLRDIISASSDLWVPYFGAEFITSRHIGKVASSEALRQSEGAEPGTICSPLVDWPEDVDVDSDLLNEVLMPYMSETIKSSIHEGGGMMLLGKIMQNTWKERRALGEPGVGHLWDVLDTKTRQDWEKVLRVHERQYGV